MKDILKPPYNYKKDVKIFLIVFFSVIVVAGLIVMCSIHNSGGSSASATTNDTSKKIEALVASQEYVKNYLKSPATAKFPTIASNNIEITKVGTDKYKVIAYVDSQNSFGAMIRNYYSCTVTLYSDKYKVENLEFSE